MRKPIESVPTVLWPQDLERRYNKNSSTIFRMTRDGRLPPHDVQLGTRRGWYRETIERHERIQSAVHGKAA